MCSAVKFSSKNLYYMKAQLLTGCLLTACLYLPGDVFYSHQALAGDDSIYIAQNNSGYDKYMELGYKATRLRNYRTALRYFEQALKVRPNDRYATAAIRNVNDYLERRRLITFVPGKPGRLTSAGTRGSWGDCFVNSRYPVPLTPTDYEVQLTISGKPKFLFYIPETTKAIQGLEFVLREAEGSKTTIYRKTFESVQQGGIISIGIPDDRPSLEVGKEYFWGLSMVCNFDDRDQDWTSKGTIKLVTNDEFSQGAERSTNPLEQAMVYAAAGLWENALSILADLRLQNPNDAQVKSYWVDLLTSVELGEVAEERFLPCCSPQI